MSLESAAIQHHNGDPILVILAEGPSDVGRLIDVLNNGYARCEHAGLAAKATRQVRRISAGRKALEYLRLIGGRNMLEAVPDDKPMRKALRLAICDPGAVLPRHWEWRDGIKGGERDYELVTEWQMRAVLSTILPWLAAPSAHELEAGR